MRDAVGGIVNISLIATFIAIISGYLAFNVSYTKAFRMKNRVITTIEQYDGVCDEKCMDDIKTYANKIGYKMPEGQQASCDDSDDLEANTVDTKYNVCEPNIGYKAEAISAGETGETEDTFSYPKRYFRVTTHIIIDIPVLNRVMPNLHILDVTGNTKIITFRKED